MTPTKAYRPLLPYVCPITTSSRLQRLYREDYHKHKDKIHTTYDTPDIKQVKMNQEHLSDVRSHPITFISLGCQRV